MTLQEPSLIVLDKSGLRLRRPEGRVCPIHCPGFSILVAFKMCLQGVYLMFSGSIPDRSDKFLAEFLETTWLDRLDWICYGSEDPPSIMHSPRTFWPQNPIVNSISKESRKTRHSQNISWHTVVYLQHVQRILRTAFQLSTKVQWVLPQQLWVLDCVGPLHVWVPYVNLIVRHDLQKLTKYERRL